MNSIFTLKMKVRDYECDMQGIVNNAVYQNYLEHARHEYFVARGVSFKKLVDQNIMAMVAHIEMDFKKPLASGDEFCVEILTQRQGVKLVFHQKIYRMPQQELCVKAKVDAVCMINGTLSRGEIFDKLLKPI